MLVNCPSCGSELRKAEELQGAAGGGTVPLADDMGLGEEDFQDLLREHPSPAAKAPSPPGSEDPPVERFLGESNGS